MSELKPKPVILIFASNERGTAPHQLTCQQGDCPLEVLTVWREEFSRVFETKEAITEVEFTATRYRTLPRRYQVEWVGAGRNKWARLTALKPLEAVSTPPLLIRANETPVSPRNWRLELLDELDRFAIEYTTTDVERWPLQFVINELRVLATERPQEFVLTLLAAYQMARCDGLAEEHPGAPAEFVMLAAAAALKDAIAGDPKLSNAPAGERRPWLAWGPLDVLCRRVFQRRAEAAARNGLRVAGGIGRAEIGSS